MKKADRTKSELAKGLREIVALYIRCRRNVRNVAGAIQIKKEIDEHIRLKKLDYKTVFFCFGDPDNPKTREEVIKRADRMELEK